MLHRFSLRLILSFAIHPRHAERDDALGLDQALPECCLLILIRVPF